MKKPRTIRGVALILLLLVLLPILVFTVYEINGLSSSESLVTDIYRRQLDVVLFSINQYAWDVVNTWASVVAVEWKPGPAGGTLPREWSEAFIGKNPAVDAIFLADSAGTGISFLEARGGGEGNERESILLLLGQERQLTGKLLMMSAKNYRKIESRTLPGSPGRRGGVVLLFVLRDSRGIPALAGIRLREEGFVRDVLAERMRDAAAGEFIVSVVRTAGGGRVFASEEGPVTEPEQRRQLWLFPELALGISLRGETIQQVARSRVNRDLVILVVLDTVLLSGVWVVYRSVRREMEFVRLKSDFVSNVSHDLRTPLALIRMYAETLEMGRLGSEKKRHEYYRTIVSEAERLTHLVNNLLNFSRMEAGRRPYALAPVDLNEVVRGALDSFAPHLKNGGFSPDVDLDPALPAVRADREAVEEALINLLDNAVKYSEEEKFLRVATGVRMDDVYVEVEDHGPGIPNAYRDRIFETFFRVPSTQGGSAKGSGLGLAIARHIMEAHGGRIDLAGAPGRGSTFTLAFKYEHDTRH